MPMSAVMILVAVQAGGFGVERVDLVSEDTGTWLNYDLPDGLTYPTGFALRFVEQVKVVWKTPWPGFSIGTSIASQSIVYEKPLMPEYQLFWSGGIQTVLLLPRGVLLGVAWRPGMFRLGFGLSMVSSATWRRPAWNSWTVLPTVGLGIVFTDS